VLLERDENFEYCKMTKLCILIVGYCDFILTEVVMYVCRSANGLHMQDVESGLYYSLWSEVPSRARFDHRALSALKLYIDVLSKVLTDALVHFLH